MKKLLLSFVLLGPLAVFGQQAHIILSTNIAVADTNAAPGTNIINAVFGTGDSKEIGFGFTLALSAATGTSSNITVTVDKTIDGTTWNLLGTCIRPANGTNVVGFWTNFSVGGIPQLRIGIAQNANTSAVPVITFWRSLKREF